MKVNSTMIRIFIVLDRHLWSSDITDFMFLLLDNFSQKVSNSQRLYVVFSHSAYCIYDVRCHFQSSPDGNKEPYFFQLFYFKTFFKKNVEGHLRRFNKRRICDLFKFDQSIHKILGFLQ